MLNSIDKECFCCESTFTVLAETTDVEFCPFCGERLEENYEDLDEDRETEDE